MSNDERLATITTLGRGRHLPGSMMCLLEAVAYVAGEPWSDHPQCVSLPLVAFGSGWNDGIWSNDERAQLIQYIPQLIGTAGDPVTDKARAWLAMDWLVRVYTPVWLRLAGGPCTKQAERLAALPPLTIKTISQTRDITIAASNATKDVTRPFNAARDATGAFGDIKAIAKLTSWNAIRTTAGDAALNAANIKPWDGDAVWATMGNAALPANTVKNWAIIGNSAWVAASNAAWIAAAAGVTLKPTVQELQASAHDLFHRMIAVH